MEIPIPHLPNSSTAQGDSTFGKLSSQDRAFLEAFGRQEAQELHGVPRPSPVDPTSLLGQLEQVTVSGYRAFRPNVPGSTSSTSGSEPSSVNNSSQPRRHDVVCELAAEEVRWFYKREVEKDWRPFMGYDSLRIELRYRHIWQTKWSDVDRRTNTLREEYHNSHRASVRTMINNAHQQRRARSLSRVHYDRATGPHTAMLMNGYVDESSQSSPMSHPSQSLHHGGPPMHHQHIPRTHPAAQEDYYDSGEYETASGGVGGGSANQSGIRPSTAGNNYNPYSQRGPHYSTRGRQKSYRHYRSSDNFINDDREMRIVVRGGVYEVDLVEWKCHSIYWPGEAFDILRGTWFHETTWQPVQCEHADRIEREHLSRFLNHKMADYVWDPTTSSRLEKQVHHTINFPEFHVDWLSPEEVYLHRENASSQIYRGISASLGFKKPTGTRLFRGYRELSSHSDKLADISHIVFVIHGVGQVVDDTTILRNTNILRDNVHAMIEKHFKSYQNETGQRIEFFPVEWRSSLTLDEGIVNIITPQRIMGLRNLLNSSAMDIMYYTSPLYRMEIWSALQEELNRIYEMFVQRNPYFEANGGKVSITAHSLGCVVTYDILTGWTQDVEHSWYSLQAHSMSHHPANHGRGRGRPAPMNEHRQTPMNAAQSGLLFRIENFFCLGSPLSVFLTLRWRDPQNTEYHDYILPRSLCKYLYNIYHPCDPVAYRVEPIFMKFYAQIEPVHLYSENDPNKSPYDKIPLQPLQGARKENVEGYSSDFTDSMLPLNIANGSINISVGKMAAGIGNPAKDLSNKIPSMTPSISLPKIPTSVPHIPGLQAASSGVSGALNGSSVGQAAGGMMGGLFGFVKDAAAAVTPGSEHSAGSTTSTTHSSSYTSHQQNRPGMPSVLPTTSSGIHGYNYASQMNKISNHNVHHQSNTHPPAKSSMATHHQEVKLPDGQRLAYRMDYVLRETGNTYIAAVTSHTAYWSNADVAYFMVKKLYPDLEQYESGNGGLASNVPQVYPTTTSLQQQQLQQQQQSTNP